VVAGKRRLLACKKLGWKNIPVTIIDIAKIVRGEHAENVQRKDFTLTEAVAIMREIEPEEKAAAKKRQGRPGAARSGNLPEREKGQARDKAAKAMGRKARTLAKAAAIVEAAEADPEKFGKLAEDMDRTGRVMGPITAASPSIMKLRALRRTAPENKSNAVQLRRLLCHNTANSMLRPVLGPIATPLGSSKGEIPSSCISAMRLVGQRNQQRSRPSVRLIPSTRGYGATGHASRAALRLPERCSDHAVARCGSLWAHRCQGRRRAFDNAAYRSRLGTGTAVRCG
jgi:hypothetical protein